MSLTNKQAKDLLPKLTEYLATQRLRNVTDADLDAGYNMLTSEEKKIILGSILGETDNARSLIITRLYEPLRQESEALAQSYIDANSIPIDVIYNKF